MSKKDALRIPDYLEHILEAIDRIHRYVDDLSEVDFLEDKKPKMLSSETSKLSAKLLIILKSIILHMPKLIQISLGH